MKRWIAVVLKLALSGFLIGFLIRSADTDAVLERLAAATPALITVAVFILIYQVAINALRWQSVLNAIAAPLPFLRAAQLVFIGIFFNQVLPSSVGGDGVRIYKAYKSGLSLSSSFNGVMLERVATVLALIVLTLMFEPVLASRADLGAAAWTFPALAVAAVFGLVLMMNLDRLPEGLRRWRVIRGLAALALDARRVFLSRRPALWTMGLAIIGNVNVALCVYVLVLSIGLGDQIGFVDCLVLVPPVLLIATLPVSIAGWGVREGAMVTGFGLIGVAPENALALSLLFGFVVLAASLPGGLVWMTERDRHLPPDTGELAQEGSETK